MRRFVITLLLAALIIVTRAHALTNGRSARDCRQWFDGVLQAPSRKVIADRGEPERTYLLALSNAARASHLKLKGAGGYRTIASLNRNTREASAEGKKLTLIFTEHARVDAIRIVEDKNETYECF